MGQEEVAAVLPGADGQNACIGHKMVRVVHVGPEDLRAAVGALIRPMAEGLLLQDRARILLVARGDAVAEVALGAR